MPRTRKHSGPIACLTLRATLAAVGCNGPRVPARPTGGIRLDAEPRSAKVYVNEKLSGTVSTFEDRPLLLRPGRYRIKLVAQGYYPGYVEVDVGDEIVPVEASLVPIPEPLGVELK
jgi:hypothetical protein